MKLLFVHDVKALVYDKQVFARSYGRSIWDRYLVAFDNILVCARSRKADKQMVTGVEQLTSDVVEFDTRIGMFKGPDVFISKRIKDILTEDIKKCDAVILRLDSFLGLQAITICRKLNKPYLIEVVGCAWDSFWNHGITGKILAPYIFLRTKKEIQRASYAVYVTSEFLQKRYPTHGKTTNISNVSLNSFDEQVLENRVNRIKAKNNQSINLMTTANVGVKYKGMQYVIRALGILRKQGITNYIYHIVGEGSQDYLKSIAKKCGVENQIVFHGAVAHEEVFRLLKETVDIYIQPSLQEGLPRAVIEAMSCAVPCMGSDVAGIPELLDKKYIFTRKRNIENQIAKMLLEQNEESLKEQALRNFEEAKKYDATTLNNRRTDFLKMFVSEIQRSKNELQ